MATAIAPTRARRSNRVRVTRDIKKAREAVAKNIGSTLESRQMTQTEAMYETGEAASQFSRIVNGHLRGVSMDRLLRDRAGLGATITIVIQDGGPGAVMVEER